MALRPARLFLIGLMTGALAACTGAVSPGGATPTALPSATPAVTTATCPPGSTPDVAGPARQARPPFGEESQASAAFDRQSGRVVHVDSEGETWTFDVCTNTWEKETTRGEAPSDAHALFYDPYDDLTYALDGVGLPIIRYYDVETSTWATVGQPGRSWAGADRFVMDPIEGVIYGCYLRGAELWAYDIGSNAITEVEQGELLPPTEWWGAMTTFDPSVGRIVLYGQRPNDPLTGPPIEPGSDTNAETWTFDLGTGTWERVSTPTPLLQFGWFMRGTEMTYDEASRSTVLVANGGMAVFSATANTWNVPQAGTGQPDMSRVNHGLVDDVVNGRVLVFGGSVPDPESDSQWQDGSDVWAYDVAENTWTELVPPRPS